MSSKEILDNSNESELPDSESAPCSSHGYLPHRGPDVVLDRREQDDLFSQMDGWISRGGLRDYKFLACEVENIYRMKATILQQRADIRGGDTAISQLEQSNATLERDNEELKDHFKKFVEFAVTCRRENTYEWMLLMQEWLTQAAERFDPDSYADMIGADHFVFRQTPRASST